MNNVQILDCTFRDGGYYTNWHFEKKLVQKYLDSMSNLGIDIVELGFRFFTTDSSKGKHAYTDDDYINKFNIPKNLKIAVMINASDFINHQNIDESINKLFPTNTNIYLVRIAAHYHELKYLNKIILALKKKKFKVGLNLMQISNYTNLNIDNVFKKIKTNYLDYIYLADSLGSMKEIDIIKQIKYFKKKWKKKMGIHTHDNQYCAVSNTIAAVNQGVNIIDSTVMGMGRGPGNAKTEIIVEYYKKISKINYSMFLDFIYIYFQPLLIKYKWGSNLYYFLSGKYKIHPSYIQEILNKPKKNHDSIINMINYFKTIKSTKYNPETLYAAMNFYKKKPKGKLLYNFKRKASNVLILGPGNSIKLNLTKINKFINENNCLVFALNTSNLIDEKLIDIRVISHPLSFFTDLNKIENINSPLLTPYSMIPNKLKNKLKNIKIYDYGIKIKNNKFISKPNYCIVPNALAISYCLAFINLINCKKIFLAGFDGYNKKNFKYAEANSFFNFYNNLNPNKIFTITSTKFNIKINKKTL